MNTLSIGNAGEDLACTLLEKKGFEIVARNYRVRGGEIDIIARRKKLLVFVEVKKRVSSSAFGGPLAAVTVSKQNKIAQTAACYLKENPVKFDSIRFDVITVLPGGAEHLESAFTPTRFSI